MADAVAICPECGATFAATDRFCQRDGAQLLAADQGDPLLGAMVGSYRIAALIGAGGMGRVYLGVHPSIGSRVAIKVLSHECAERPELIERFFAEAQLVNRIRHEGIVNVLDLTHLPDGRPTIVMELLDGEPLSALLARCGPLEQAHAAAIVVPLLGALAAAHERGVVHRDLKPDNVFITRQGRVVALDFGIAKLLPEGRVGDERVAPTTRTGAVLGTPGYMAPELIQGRPTVPATDLYAVGVILYQLLGGRLPFDGDSLFEIMQKHVSAPVPPLRAMRPDVAPALEAVVLRAMAKEPGMRFAGARQMAEAVAAALGGGTGEIATVPLPVRAPRRRALLVGGGLGALLVAAVAVVAVVASGEDAGPRASAAPDAPAVPAVPAATATPVEEAGAADAGAAPEASHAPEAVAQAEEEARPSPGGGGGPAKPAPRAPARPGTRPGAKADAKPDAKPDAEPGAEPAPSSGTSGVTIINTAELAQKMTGLKTITAVPASSGGSFDPIRTLAQAESMAHKLMPDAVLVGFDIDHARPDGSALLRADSGATYRFRSPSRSKRPADVPRNVEVDIPCMIHVEVVRGKIAASPVTDEECDDARLPHPRCRIADLWRRAREQGAPTTGDWVAKISYMHDGWFVDIPKAGKPPLDDFDVSLTDDCH